MLSTAGVIKKLLFCLLICILLKLVMPTAHAIANAIDNYRVISLLQKVVKEGEIDSLYGVEQIYNYLQEGFDSNSVKLKARDIIKAETEGDYVTLTLDYRQDNKIFGQFYLSNIYYQTYRTGLKYNR